MKVNEESEKAVLKLNIHFIANRGETMKTVTDFISGGSKITADGGFGHEIQRHWLLRRKVMTKLDNILKI